MARTVLYAFGFCWACTACNLERWKCTITVKIQFFKCKCRHHLGTMHGISAKVVTINVYRALYSRPISVHKTAAELDVERCSWGGSRGGKGWWVRLRPLFFRFTLALSKTYPKTPENGISDIPDFGGACPWPPKQSHLRTPSNKTLDPPQKEIYVRLLLAWE